MPSIKKKNDQVYILFVLNWLKNCTVLYSFETVTMFVITSDLQNIPHMLCR